MSDIKFREDKIDTAEALQNSKLAELTDASKRLTDLEDEIANAEAGEPIRVWQVHYGE